jgi:CheY-like chemotaxis protein
MLGPILVVEDDLDLLTLLGEALQRKGYAVVPATDGGEALSYLQSGQTPPKLILLDLMMPQVDGARFCEQLSLLDDCRCIPVFVLTGAGVARAKAQTLGAALVFRKPLDLGSLLDAVSHVVTQ